MTKIPDWVRDRMNNMTDLEKHQIQIRTEQKWLVSRIRSQVSKLEEVAKILDENPDYPLENMGDLMHKVFMSAYIIDESREMISARLEKMEELEVAAE